MTCYELALGDEQLSEFVDRLARDAGLVAPGLNGGGARALIDLILRTRLRSCATCAREPDCANVRPGQHLHDDAQELASICALNAADLLAPGPGRQALERQLARALHACFAPVVVDGQDCARPTTLRPR